MALMSWVRLPSDWINYGDGHHVVEYIRRQSSVGGELHGHGGIQTGLIQQSTFLPFAEQQQQALLPYKQLDGVVS